MPVAASSNPFDDYLRTQVKFDKEVMRVLEEAARDAQRTIAALKLQDGLGARVRQAQLTGVLAEIRNEQASMWASVGKATQAGRKAAAEAAQEALEVISRVAYASLAPAAAEALTEGLKATARAGINSAYARVPRALSEAVYRNGVVASGKIDDLVRKGLIQGLSAKEMAASVYQFVSPTTPGGASYAASRLARTEINNAFHLQQIAAADAPGVSGVKWNLSGSHPRPDECNDFAERNKYDMGPGVYPKLNVPSKPHPHCFCYLSYITMDPEEFAAAMTRGKFDDEIRRRAKINADLLRGMEPVKAPAAKRVRTARQRKGPASGAEVKPTPVVKPAPVVTKPLTVTETRKLAEVKAAGAEGLVSRDMTAAVRQLKDRGLVKVEQGPAIMRKGSPSHAFRITDVDAAPRAQITIPKVTRGRDLTTKVQNADLTQYFDVPAFPGRAAYADNALTRLIMDQDYGLPGRGTAGQLDELAGKGWQVVHRGFTGGETVSSTSAIEEFMTSSTYFTGLGIYGNGIYTSIDKRVAKFYSKLRDAVAGPSKGKTVRMAINPDARVIELEKLQDLQREAIQAYRNDNLEFLSKFKAFAPSAADQAEYDRIYSYISLLGDEGRFATMKGYDVIKVVKRGDGANIGTGDATQYIILNRSVLVVERPVPTLAERIASGIADTKRLSGGVQAQTELVTFKDGTQAVRKTIPKNSIFDGKRLQDAEELGSVLARSLGMRAPEVVRESERVVWMEYMPGVPGSEKLIEKGAGTFDEILTRLTNTEDGRRIGLFDFVTGNIDRNGGNWLVNGDGITAIDHGLAFTDRPGKLSNVFYTALFDSLGEGLYSPADLDFIADKLREVRAQFKRLDRMDWYTEANVRLDELRGKAKWVAGKVFA